MVAIAQLILIIDDSITIRAILEMIVLREGCAAQSFPDGFAALHWLASPEGRVSALMFLDLTMPRMDGLSVLRHLKSKPALAAVPVIVLTCREGTLDRLKARLAGASEYLTKPFTQEEITVLLLRYLDDSAQEALPIAYDHLIFQPQGER